MLNCEKEKCGAGKYGIKMQGWKYRTGKCEIRKSMEHQKFLKI